MKTTQFTTLTQDQVDGIVKHFYKYGSIRKTARELRCWRNTVHKYLQEDSNKEIGKAVYQFLQKQKRIKRYKLYGKICFGISVVLIGMYFGSYFY